MNSHLRRLAGLVIALGVSGAAGFGQMYNQTTLVVNTGTATTTDPSLVNGWGIARGSGTPWWVSDNLT